MLPVCDMVNGNEVYIGSLLAFVEMIKSGTTCVLDNPPMFVGKKDCRISPVENTGIAMKETGIRGIIVPGAWENEDCDVAVNEYNRLFKKWHEKADGRLQIWPSPMIPSSRELLVALNNVAKKYNVGITTHLAETNGYVQKSIDMYNKRHVPFLAETGLLGSNFVGSHAIWLTDFEMKLLAQTESKVVYAPGSVMSQGSGISPVIKMLKLGVTVALGSDGAAFNVDMFEEMRLSALIQKGYNLDPKCLPAQKVLEMATIDGAKTLMLDHTIGSLEKGKKADLIIVDLKKPHVVPRHDIIQSIVYGARGSDVETVLINGKIVMENKIIAKFNEKEIVDNAEKAALDLVRRAELNIT
jgi:5-methylthioadenosine/S-adenosylhomocysteine deaminase